MRGLKRRESAAYCLDNSSHPSRMRGLKLLPVACQPRYIKVASFTDAWIETL